MKLDINRAWQDTLALIRGNAGTVATVAGVFFFLPYFALMLFVPRMLGGLESQVQAQNSEAMVQAMMGAYAHYWWVFLLVALIQGTGMLALMIVLADRSRPTVGEALATALKLLPSYIAASLIMAFGIAVIGALIASLGSVVPARAVGVLLSVVALFVVLYLLVRLYPFPPVVALEREYNPVKALLRAWHLTKGNSMRLFLFFALLLIAFLVVSLVVSMLLGLVFSLFGAEIALIGNSLVGSLMNAAFAVVLLAALAATYRLLSAERVSVPPTV